ncbi:MAG: hypothetical protein MK160_01840 [Rhodobacteraceae bacterium]|nr:hypothetical protein [Paracoccaceae bacterium]
MVVRASPTASVASANLGQASGKQSIDVPGMQLDDPVELKTGDLRLTDLDSLK